MTKDFTYDDSNKRLTPDGEETKTTEHQIPQENTTEDSVAPGTPASKEVSKAGISAMRGEVPVEDVQTPSETKSENAGHINPKDDQSFEEKIKNPENWEYKTRSPHKEYENYKAIQQAKRQHEIGQQAATAGTGPDDLIEAIDTTLKAKKAANDNEEKKFDEYFYSKYGRTPYESDFYPQDEEKRQDDK